MLDFFEVSVDHVVIGLVRLGSAFRLGTGGLLLSGTLLLSSGVQLLTDLLSGSHQLLNCAVDRVLVFAALSGFNSFDLSFTGSTVSRIHLVTEVLQGLLNLGDGGISLIAGLSQIEAALILSLVRFGFLHHAVDFRIRQTGARLDLDVVRLAGSLVLRAHVQDAVRVDIEGHFNLRQSARRRRDAFEVELAE